MKLKKLRIIYITPNAITWVLVIGLSLFIASHAEGLKVIDRLFIW